MRKRTRTSYSLLVRNLMRTCLRYLKLTSSSLELLCLAVTVLDELGLRIAAEASTSLSIDEVGILSSRWSVFFMSANRCCKTLIV